MFFNVLCQFNLDSQKDSLVLVDVLLSSSMIIKLTEDDTSVPSKFYAIENIAL